MPSRKETTCTEAAGQDEDSDRRNNEDLLFAEPESEVIANINQPPEFADLNLAVEQLLSQRQPNKLANYGLPK